MDFGLRYKVFIEQWIDFVKIVFGSIDGFLKIRDGAKYEAIGNGCRFVQVHFEWVSDSGAVRLVVFPEDALGILTVNAFIVNSTPVSRKSASCDADRRLRENGHRTTTVFTIVRQAERFRDFVHAIVANVTDE